jgi:type VI protein secretion system component Hcp
MGKAYYLKLGSGNEQIIGSSRDRYHVGWIKLTGFRPTETGGLSPVSAGPGRATISEFELSKLEDISSPRLFLASNEGRHFRTAELEIADERTGIPELHVMMTDDQVDRYSANPNVGANDPRPSETFTLHFASLKYNFNPIPPQDALDLLVSVFKTLGLAPAQ